MTDPNSGSGSGNMQMENSSTEPAGCLQASRLSHLVWLLVMMGFGLRISRARISEHA